MRRLLFVAFALLLASPAAAQRLPGGVTPEHYTLWFAPDLDKATFRGRETIRVRVDQPTTSITLHAAEITFGEVTITAGGETQRARVTTDAKTETARFTVDRTLPAGPASIAVTYSGILNDKLRGFYLSSANGRKYAVSQMEATDARRAFPSFDEPAYKATFDISLTVAAERHRALQRPPDVRHARPRAWHAHGGVCDDAEDVHVSGGAARRRFRLP